MRILNIPLFIVGAVIGVSVTNVRPKAVRTRIALNNIHKMLYNFSKIAITMFHNVCGSCIIVGLPTGLFHAAGVAVCSVRYIIIS